MNNHGKYIVVEWNGIESLFAFDNLITHSEFARKLQIPSYMIISAGFIQIGITLDNKIDLLAYGNSFSLDIGSRPEDTILLERLIFGMK